MDGLATIDGKVAHAYVNDRPWHGLGFKLPGLMTPSQALIAGSCDWPVVKLGCGVLDGDFPEYDGVEIPNTYITGRVGPELQSDGVTKKFTPFEGSVKGRYTLVQNLDAFSFLEPALGGDISYIETVGALGNGERVWAMAKLPDDFEPIPGDPVERYILVTNSHDGSGTLKALFTPIRVVCRNTLTAALYSCSNVVSLRHTSSITSKVQMLDEMMGASAEYWTALKDAYKALTMNNMSSLDVIDFIEEIFPGKREVVKVGGKTIETVKVSTRTENNRAAVIGLFNGFAQGSDKAKQTRYGMFNAYTEWLDGTNPSKDLQRSIRKDSNHWEASVFGSGADLRQRAFNKLAAMV